MLNSVLKTVTLESGTALDVYLKVALTDARVFLRTVGIKSYTCGHCGRRRMVKSSHTDDVRALLVASKLCLECYESLTTDRPVAPVVSPVEPTPACTFDTATITKVLNDIARQHHTKEDSVDDVKAPAAFPSRMAFQVLRTDEDLPTGQFAIRMRHLFTNEMAASGVDYDQTQHFMLHETCSFLDDWLATHGTRTSGLPMVYGLLTVDGTGKDGKDDAATWFAGIVGQGNRKAHGIYDVQSKTRFRAIVWSAIDRITAILVPMDSDVYRLEDLGIELTSSPKAPKRLRRGAAPHQAMLKFTVDHTKTETTPDGTVYHLRHASMDRVFRVMVFNMTTLSPEDVSVVDGMGILKILSILGGKEYNHVKKTVVLPTEGLDKGFGHNFDCFTQVEYDAVLFGMKPELMITGDIAYIGALGTLKETPAYMDIQSFTNMGCYEPQLAPAEGTFWMDEVHRVRFGEDEDVIRDQNALFARLADAKAERDAAAGRPGQPEDQQASVRAAKLMIENQSLPVLFRRDIQRALENSIDITRGRIYMGRVARRINLCPNPLVFTTTGRPSQALDHLTHERFPHVPKAYEIVCDPAAPEGPMLMWRNPNTMKWEAILVWNVHLPELMTYRFLGFVFFGYEACTLLVRMNGADMDDSVIVISDPAYIQKWQSLEYPLVEKIAADATSRHAVNEYAAQEAAKYQPVTRLWNQHIGDQDIERWRTTTIGLGTVINLIALDTLLSGEHQAHAVAQLEQGVFWAPDNFSGGDPAVFAQTVALPYLKARRPFQNRRVATNSEYVIDWFQQHAGNEVIAKGLIDESQQVLTYTDAQGKLQPIPVFPKSWALPGGKRKIPRTRLETGDYLLVETKVCRALNVLAAQRDDLLEAARLKEWQLVRGIPLEVDAKYPTTDFTGPVVEDLRKKWRVFLDAARATHQKGWYTLAANGDDVKQAIKPGEEDYSAAKAAAGEPQERKVHIEGLREHYFYMKGSDDRVIPIPLHARIGLAAEWLRRVYDVDVQDPKRNPDGTTRHFGDGVPDFVLHDFFTALEVCGLTGLVVYATLDPRAKRRLRANGVPVQVKLVTGRVKSWVIDRKNGLKLGTVPTLVQVPDGVYPMSPEGVVVVQTSDSRLHSRYTVDRIAQRVVGVVDEVRPNFEDDDDPYAF